MRASANRLLLIDALPLMRFLSLRLKPKAVAVPKIGRGVRTPAATAAPMDDLASDDHRVRRDVKLLPLALKDGLEKREMLSIGNLRVVNNFPGLEEVIAK